jgi:hypothetical protein
MWPLHDNLPYWSFKTSFIIASDVLGARSNAVAEHGKLVNKDAIGNRVAALIIFGPRWLFS